MTDRQTIETALTKVNELEKRIRMLSRVAAALGARLLFPSPWDGSGRR